jgi:hypothetical protein
MYWGPNEKEVKKIPKSYMYIAGSGLGLSIALLPNAQGWLNHSAYRHFKGFLEANLALTPLLTEIVRLGIGKERPYYDQMVSEGETPHGKDRMSFWSPDAAASFSMATYFNLFVINNLGRQRPLNWLWKAPIVIGTYGVAMYASTIGISAHMADAVDVTVGAVAGSLIAILTYALHENWFGEFYKDNESNIKTRALISDFSIQLYPGGLAIRGRYF